MKEADRSLSSYPIHYFFIFRIKTPPDLSRPILPKASSRHIRLALKTLFVAMTVLAFQLLPMFQWETRRGARPSEIVKGNDAAVTALRCCWVRGQSVLLL
jgi:hypothetical protein